MTTRRLAAVCVLAAPLLYGIADQLRMRAEPPAPAGIVAEYGVAQAAANLAAARDATATFTAAAVAAFLAALLAIPALVGLWRLAADRSPRWAWAGAVLAVLSVVGQVGHVVGYHVVTLALAAQPDLDAAARFQVALEEQPVVALVVVPVLLGLLAPLVQGVALYRARRVPRWAAVALGAGTALFAVVGSTPWSSALTTLLLLAGFAPAAAVLAGAQRSPSPAS